MTTPHRFGPAISAVVLATMLAGCAAPQEKTGFGGKVANAEVGLATRALMALNAKNAPEAIDFAQRAVEKTPNDAGFRALLGNAYFAAGRFASAEAAYKDSLSLYSNQPQVILKLALAQTALGKKGEAVAFLHAGQSVLDASNYGLALALAGDTSDAVQVLDAAARKPGADATIRQNLALAHALAGDWAEAKTIAAQDLPADKVDGRVQQWMQLASPKKPADQVAALVGVTPAAADQGQPVRLALRRTDTMMAQAAPAPVAAPTPLPVKMASAPAPAATIQEAGAFAPPPPLPPAPVEVAAAPAPAPVALPPALVETVAAPARAFVAEASAVGAAAKTMLVNAAYKAQTAVASFVPHKASAAKPKARRIAAAAHRGDSGVVMQIGSYRSPEQVSAGWAHLTERYPSLRSYLPMRARFDSASGTYWRLSIQGFDNQREAIARCNLLKSRGGHCFVRGAAGDRPVEIASN